MMQQGVQTWMDPATNNIYSERAIPIELGYKLTLLTTNVQDMDELVREIIFKYKSMFFLHLNLPYEGNRTMRFGVEIVEDDGIARSSSTSDYIGKGQLHQAIISLRCQGAVLVTYTTQKLRRTEYEIEVE